MRVLDLVFYLQVSQEVDGLWQCYQAILIQHQLLQLSTPFHTIQNHIITSPHIPVHRSNVL